MNHVNQQLRSTDVFRFPFYVRSVELVVSCWYESNAHYSQIRHIRRRSFLIRCTSTVLHDSWFWPFLVKYLNVWKHRNFNFEMKYCTVTTVTEGNPKYQDVFRNRTRRNPIYSLVLYRQYLLSKHSMNISGKINESRVPFPPFQHALMTPFHCYITFK